MKFRLIIILSLLILNSCKEEEKKPVNVLSENDMIEVITEIELTQALVKLKFSNPDTLIDRQEIYNQTFHNFNITQQDFNKSLTYYCKQPTKLTEIYEKVINNLSEDQESSK